MNLKLQKRLAARILKSSQKRIKLDPSKLRDIGEGITKTDVRELIGDGIIKAKQKKGVSRARANKIKNQKKKGLRKGHGSRKGSAFAKTTKKERWMSKVRVQRLFIKELKDKKIVSQENYRNLYKLVKGGFFRSKRHIKLFIEEKGMVK